MSSHNPQGKRRQAAALKYTEGMGAPVLLAKGEGRTAEEIVKRAEEAGIYIKDDAVLAEELMRLHIGDSIPEKVYQVVAELLAFVYKVYGEE